MFGFIAKWFENKRRTDVSVQTVNSMNSLIKANERTLKTNRILREQLDRSRDETKEYLERFHMADHHLSIAEGAILYHEKRSAGILKSARVHKETVKKQKRVMDARSNIILALKTKNNEIQGELNDANVDLAFTRREVKKLQKGIQTTEFENARLAETVDAQKSTIKKLQAEIKKLKTAK